MRKSLLPVAMLAACHLGLNAEIKIEPPMWWTGMESQKLQLMVTGDDIRDAEVAINYEGVTVDSIVDPDSKNYKFIYLDIARNTQPGTMKIDFKKGKKTTSQSYELLKREQSPDNYKGFDQGDALYLIMPDRFADGNPKNNDIKKGLKHPVTTDRSNPNARHGGDLQGIIDHLDYIEQLGVTAIWLTPVLENDMPGGSYHGYATTDYYRVDPRFGSNDDYKRLIEECHKRDIKVVMDMIFNHCGLSHPWIADMPFRDWLNSPIDTKELSNINVTGGEYHLPKGYRQTNFRLNTNHDPYGSNYDLSTTVDGWFTLGMPDLNQRNTHLMTYLIQNSIWWIEYAKINGIRMDTYPYADMKAMAAWNKRIAEEYPDFNIVGESWFSSEASIAYMQKGNKMNPIDTELKTVMDFPLMISAKQTFAEDTKPWGEGLNRLYDHLALDFLFADPMNVLTFLDNHDSDRFLDEMPTDLTHWKQAIAFLLTSRGIPQIYYGTELLMNGTKKISDGNIRLDMPGGFPGDATNEFVSEGRTPIQNEAFNYICKLLSWRKGNTAISEGSTKQFMPTNGLYVYCRESGNRKAIVILNGKDEDLKGVDMSRYEEIMQPGMKLTNIVTGESVEIQQLMDFPARATLILE